MSTRVCSEQYRLDKSDFEGIIKDLHQEEIVLTDGQWIEIAREIVGRMDNFVEVLLSDIANDVIDGNYDE